MNFISGLGFKLLNKLFYSLKDYYMWYLNIIYNLLFFFKCIRNS